MGRLTRLTAHRPDPWVQSLSSCRKLSCPRDRNPGTSANRSVPYHCQAASRAEMRPLRVETLDVVLGGRLIARYRHEPKFHRSGARVRHGDCPSNSDELVVRRPYPTRSRSTRHSRRRRVDKNSEWCQRSQLSSSFASPPPTPFPHM